MNIKFEYLYRDAGNNKKYGSVVFENRKCLRIELLRRKILRLVGDEGLFTASKFGVPGLFFEEYPYDPELDYDEHEFIDVPETSLPVDDLAIRDIGTLLENIELNSAVSL